ncbi:hypothetical protein MACH18_36580 [Phaeobacter italicus]|uniref:BRO family protein n=1 Tax=Phaeobacter italicus TaxID=481446 RepID=UPI00275EDBEE|nr:BRO family protein [Phaeobacter italicus]GLO76578.1 hypothetical protein MACH18_36580 [Phaeobacter italicus]
MDIITSNFAEIKVGLLTLFAGCVDGQLVFHANHLFKQLKLEDWPECVEDEFFLVKDKTGKDHMAISEQGLYLAAFASRAKVACQFQNWVLHCVLPAVLVDRFYFIGEESGGTPSDLSLDPKEAFYGLPEAHQFWLAEQVLPTVRQDGDFFTDLGRVSRCLPDAHIKELKLDFGWRSNGGGVKLARFHQQASRKRFVRIAKQFQQMRAVEDMPQMSFVCDDEFEAAS